LKESDVDRFMFDRTNGSFGVNAGLVLNWSHVRFAAGSNATLKTIDSDEVFRNKKGDGLIDFVQECNTHTQTHTHHTHTHTHTHTITHIHIHTYTHSHVHTLTYTHTYTHTRIHTRMHKCIHIHTLTLTHIQNNTYV
jgi:hypothetical protein